MRALNAKFPVEERDTASIIIDHSGPPPDMYDVQVGTVHHLNIQCLESGIRSDFALLDPEHFKMLS